MAWREWLGKMSYLENANPQEADEFWKLIEGFKLLAEEHEAAGRMLSPEAYGREERAIADHDRKWQDVDVFLRGLGT